MLCCSVAVSLFMLLSICTLLWYSHGLYETMLKLLTAISSALSAYVSSYVRLTIGFAIAPVTSHSSPV